MELGRAQRCGDSNKRHREATHASTLSGTASIGASVTTNAFTKVPIAAASVVADYASVAGGRHD